MNTFQEKNKVKQNSYLLETNNLYLNHAVGKRVSYSDRISYIDVLKCTGKPWIDTEQVLILADRHDCGGATCYKDNKYFVEKMEKIEGETGRF